MTEQLTRLSGQSLDQIITILDALPFYVLLVDEDHVVIGANQATCGDLGLERHRICGQHCPGIVHGLEGPFPGCPLEESLHTGGLVERELCDDRTGRWVSSAIYPTAHLTEAGKRIYIHFVRDITEHKRLEQERGELEARLGQAQKLEAVGQLAAGIAHDFNNILTVILTHCGLINQELPPGDAVRDDVDRILTAAGHGVALAKQLLGFGRKSAPQLRTLDLNEVVSEVAWLLRHSVSSSVTIELQLAPRLQPVEADRVQLEQVLINLAINARDAMPAGGRIVIVTRNVPGDALPAALARGGGEGVLLSVEDEGQGIEPGLLQRVFVPFFTTKPKGRGTGLGLSTVRAIVEQHGGEILVDSQPGRGTRFEIYLAASKTPARARTSASHRAVAVQGQTVLLVDDDPAIRSAVDRILHGVGFRVLRCCEAAEALAAAEAHPEVALLLTDIVLPGESGLELARQVRQLRPGLKVVYMTGFAEEVPPDADRALLLKPFDADTLLRVIHEALDTGTP